MEIRQSTVTSLDKPVTKLFRSKFFVSPTKRFYVFEKITPCPADPLSCVGGMIGPSFDEACYTGNWKFLT